MSISHWTESVHHDGSPRYVQGNKDTLGTAVTLRVRAEAGAPITCMFLRTCPDGDEVIVPMRLSNIDDLCQWWETELQLHMPSTNYRFLLNTSEGDWWLTRAGMIRHYPTDATDFIVLASYASPSWVLNSVFYEIFPDRFADGDPTTNVRTNEYLYQGVPVVARSWGECPSFQSNVAAAEFFGGDLKGIVQKLDYLEDLGINALYLTPIFTSPSNHKYDPQSYWEVDPHFGGDNTLIALREALNTRNMRVVLDITPNHCGSMHPWFVEAQADSNAPTIDFFFRRYPDQYEAWHGIPTLPKLNYQSERLRELMYAGEGSILRHWLRQPFSIDGWRLDVANSIARFGGVQLGHKIGRGLRRAIKEERPDAYIIGEHPYDGTPHLQGDELDASMNYLGFTYPLLNWLGSAQKAQHRQIIPTEIFAAQLKTFLVAVPWQIAIQQFNLLSSHDTPRVFTALGGDIDCIRVAVVLLFTYPGVPCIFYGDEIGMQGNQDPDCRRCMIWEPTEWNTELREWYQRLIHLRRSSPALCSGGFQFLYAAGGTLAFHRDAPEEQILVVVRREYDGLTALKVRHIGLPDGTPMYELLTGAEAVVTDGMLALSTLPQIGAQVWRVERESTLSIPCLERS